MPGRYHGQYVYVVSEVSGQVVTDFASTPAPRTSPAKTYTRHTFAKAWGDKDGQSALSRFLC